MHNKFASTLLKKFKGTKEKEPIPHPTMICDYNNHMVVVVVLLNDYSLNLEMVGKVFWKLMDITTLNVWIIIYTNFPDSFIDSHKSFQLHLIDELTQPLLDLMASTDCPPHLQDARGKKIVTTCRKTFCIQKC